MSKKNILLIENNKFVEIFFRDIFSFFEGEHSYCIMTASNIKAAQEAIDKVTPDVIFIDPHTPEDRDIRNTHNSLPSEKLIKSLRENSNTKSLKIVAFSSHKDEDLERRMLKAGADKFVIKGESLDDGLVKIANQFAYA